MPAVTKAAALLLPVEAVLGAVGGLDFEEAVLGGVTPGTEGEVEEIGP